MNATSSLFGLIAVILCLSTSVEAAHHHEPTWATPYILTTGTFFYVGIAVSFLLWWTGYALDYLTDRQERLAAKKAAHTYGTNPVTLTV
ncbi:hypothetical protein BCR43DRAFT_516341 [Syncephalastrum racemosum]|uniref:Dolichol-phosphate mannosyltransferase subunit 3 n=1 Tax=Syncephalastrum racemosum TaxID=13706 RepID=A0A1X2H9E4_SYNRA|nr:hypothetical protein BCR43DRAFT_516341 [Syncephalastrum racemosum]